MQFGGEKYYIFGIPSCQLLLYGTAECLHNTLQTHCLGSAAKLVSDNSPVGQFGIHVSGPKDHAGTPICKRINLSLKFS